MTWGLALQICIFERRMNHALEALTWQKLLCTDVDKDPRRGNPGISRKLDPRTSEGASFKFRVVSDHDVLKQRVMPNMVMPSIACVLSCHRLRLPLSWIAFINLGAWKWAAQCINITDGQRLTPPQRCRDSCTLFPTLI
jgi:hypothetical protein